MCGYVGKKRSEADALAEKAANGWGDIPLEECAVVCDDCYDKAITQKMEDTRHPDDHPVMFRR